MPSRPPVSHPYLDSEHPIAFAHRGGAHDVPENTMRAFEYAVKLGYRYVETDVHSTSDGVLVAFHDASLLRTCGIPGRIRDLTWEQVSAARVSGTDPIPRLAELLEAWPHLRLNIDCKSDDALLPLVRELQRSEVLDRVCVGAFNDARLQRIRQILGPQLCTSLGPREVARLVLGRPLQTTALAAQVPTGKGPVPITTERTLARAHDLGLQVHVWTIDDGTEMNRLLDLGVDGIMTDRPVVLKDVLTERDAWS